MQNKAYHLSRIFFPTLLCLFTIALLQCVKSGDTSSANTPGNSSPTPTETVAPTIGTSISFGNLGATSVTVHWGAASDNATATSNLEYKVVKDSTSSSAIDTIAEADGKVGGDIVQNWTAAITSKNAAGLTSFTTYYFAVLVRDASGNKALYAPASTIPSPVCGNGIIESPEVCDDGNTANGDGCSSTCIP